jgi:SAM-dependent methyltransferase
VLDYDKEAARYDATRGGDARADAAAAAIIKLLPGTARRIVDLACGTGIVTVRLAGPGRTVLGIDRSAGMAAVAARRLPGRIAVGDATRLPLGSGSADAVTIVWLLHLLSPDQAERVIAEAARVLRPDGALITTVDKSDAAYRTGDDLARLIWPVRAGTAAAQAAQADAADRVIALARTYGLEPAAETTFTGTGQGLSPRAQARQLRERKPGWATEELHAALAALPDQDRPRADPVYKLLSLRKTLSIRESIDGGAGKLQRIAQQA